MGRIRTSWTQMQSTAAEAEQASPTSQVQFACDLCVYALNIFYATLTEFHS